MTFNGKSALVLGDNDSFWVKEFIINVLVPLGFKISLQKKPDKTERFSECYEVHNVSFVANYRLNSLLAQIPRIRVYSHQRRKLKALNKSTKFDYVFILFVTPFDLKCAATAVKKHGRIISIFIGSDLLRANENTIKDLKKMLISTNSNVVSIDKITTNEFNKIISERNLHIGDEIHFGKSVFPYIDNLYQNGIAYHKEAHHLPRDKTSVCIGYNASPAQQHILVINEISKMAQGEKNKIHLLLPMAYGGTQEYIHSVELALANSGVTYSVITKFLDLEETASLRIATDIFINAQTTDAFAASVQEAIYAGAIMLNAKWLVYETAKELGIKYEEFADFTELSAKIVQILPVANNRERNYRNVLNETFSWTTCREKWKLYLKTINQN